MPAERNTDRKRVRTRIADGRARALAFLRTIYACALCSSTQPLKRITSTHDAPGAPPHNSTRVYLKIMQNERANVLERRTHKKNVRRDSHARAGWMRSKCRAAAELRVDAPSHAHLSVWLRGVTRMPERRTLAARRSLVCLRRDRYASINFAFERPQTWHLCWRSVMLLLLLLRLPPSVKQTSVRLRCGGVIICSVKRCTIHKMRTPSVGIFASDFSLTLACRARG